MLIWNRLPTTEKLIEGEIQLLEDHRNAKKEILTRHFYDMSNMIFEFGIKNVFKIRLYVINLVTL